MHARTMTGGAVAMLVLASVAAQPAGQSPATADQATAAQTSPSNLELYHVHFVKAAPGKIKELIAAYQQAPVEEGKPGPALIFRHVEGDDWDLLVLTPLGKEERVTPGPPPEQQQAIAQMRPLRTQHGDTFTSGPPWPEVRAALLGAAASRPTGTSGSAANTSAAAGTSGAAANVAEGTIYTVTTYRSLPGHRDQLAGILRRLAALYPDRRTILQHVEGAPWEFVMISRYDSWNDLGQDEVAPPERLRAQGFANSEAIGLELREHTAEHRDTIVRMVK